MNPDSHSAKMMRSGSAFRKIMEQDPNLVKMKIWIPTFSKTQWIWIRLLKRLYLDPEHLCTCLITVSGLIFVFSRLSRVASSPSSFRSSSSQVREETSVRIRAVSSIRIPSELFNDFLHTHLPLKWNIWLQIRLNKYEEAFMFQCCAGKNNDFNSFYTQLG